jgi:PAS domain S-box-containing protein
MLSSEDLVPAASVEAQVSDILDSFDEGFCAFDGDWRITHCNRAAETYSGLRRADVIGRSYWEAIPGAAGGEMEPILREAMVSGVSIAIEIDSATRPGTRVAVRAFRFQSGLAIGFRDVTRRHKRQKAEREQSVRLDLAMAAAGLGDWSWDIATDIVTFSPRAAAIFGLPPGPTRTWTEINRQINEEDQARAGRAVLEALESGGVYEVEFRARPPSLGREIWVLSRGQTQSNAAGVPTGIIGVVSDISHAKAREAQLRESEARFRVMADSAPAPVWVTTAEGPVEFVNQAFCEYSGRSREATIGEAWIAMLHPEDLPAFAAARLAARQCPIPQPYRVEARFRNADGEWRWMDAISRPRFNEAGVFQGYVGIAMDLTDIRAAEARQQLMINELNHRVKNTLATVQSLAMQTARLAVSKEEFKEKFLARLMALNAAHSRLTQTSWGWTPLSDLVADQLGVHGADGRLEASGPPVSVPPRSALPISLALHELATNAVKYGALSGDQGRVTLSWRVRACGAGADDAALRQAVDLEWREEGGPPVTPPTAHGFGSRLLETVGRDLSGEAHLAFLPQGLRWTVSFPLVG